MARQQKVGIFGQFTPTGVDASGAEVLSRLSGLAGQAGDIAFGIGAQKAEEQGRIEGLKSADKPLELRDDTLSIRNKAFNQAAILAHRAKIQRESRERLDFIQEENKNDPAMFELMAKSYLDGTTQQMPDELSVLVRDDIESSIASRKSQLNKRFFQAVERQNIADLNEGLESATDEILNATRLGDIERVSKLSIESDAMINSAVEAGILDPARAQEIRENTAERIQQQKTLKQVDDIVFSEDLSLEQKVLKGDAFIEDLRKGELEDLSPEQRDSLINVVEGKVSDVKRQLAEFNSQRNIQTEKQVSDLKVSAKNSFEDAQTLIERTERFHNQGIISGNERTSILNDVFGGSRKRRKELQDLSLVAKKLTGDFPEIVLQQETVDRYYDQVYSPQTEGLDSVAKTALQAQYVSVLKAVPTQIKREIENNLLSGDVDLIVQSSELINRIDEIPGLPELAVSANQRAFAEQVVNLSQNLEPEQAVNIARELTDPRDKARVEARTQLIKDDELQEKYSDWVEDGFEGFFGGDFLVDNVNKQAVEAEFKTNFEAFFKAGMDESRAKEKAIGLLQRNWKESQFGFMKYPPEEYYRVGQDVDYMKDQLVSDIRKGFVGIDFKKKNVFLLSDEKTSRKAAQGAPDYRVMVIDNNGEIQMLSGRWKPDAQKEQDRQIKQNEALAQEIRQ